MLHPQNTKGKSKEAVTISSGWPSGRAPRQLRGQCLLGQLLLGQLRYRVSLDLVLSLATETICYRDRICYRRAEANTS